MWPLEPLEAVVKPRVHDVARPPRPCHKGEGTLATAGLATVSKMVLENYLKIAAVETCVRTRVMAIAVRARIW